MAGVTGFIYYLQSILINAIIYKAFIRMEIKASRYFGGEK
jgi:hypothetical protein